VHSQLCFCGCGRRSFFFRVDAVIPAELVRTLAPDELQVSAGAQSEAAPLLHSVESQQRRAGCCIHVADVNRATSDLVCLTYGRWSCSAKPHDFPNPETVPAGTYIRGSEDGRTLAYVAGPRPYRYAY
jgi:hypothetical protein